MVEALQPRSDSPQAIEAPAALPRVDGPAQFQRPQKIHLLDVRGVSLPGRLAGPCRCFSAHAANLFGQAHLRHVTLLAPFHQPQNTARSQPANRFARRACGKVDILRQSRNRKPQPSLSFQVAVSQQMDIHDVVDHPQPQLRRHHIFDLLPKRLRIDFFSRPVPFLRAVAFLCAESSPLLSLSSPSPLTHGLSTVDSELSTERAFRHTYPAAFTIFHDRRSCRRADQRLFVVRQLAAAVGARL